MSPSIFYREQAALQAEAAEAATLDNVRERCRRAAEAWLRLATRGDRHVTAGDEPSKIVSDASGEASHPGSAAA